VRIPFVKMHGAGNDFIVVDHRVPLLPTDPGALVAAMCDRRRGVGADGVLLLESDPELDFAMRYWNADGRPADYCGNGARCLARFALDRGLGRDGRVRFRTAVGVQEAERLADGRLAVTFGKVARDGEALSLEAAGRRFEGCLIGAGVPHFVAGVERLAEVPLGDWAPALRHHPRFGAAGANVDFVERLAPGRVAMRTWERGVEGETLACGSGAIATAVWAARAGERPPIAVLTAGGDTLIVSLDEAAGAPHLWQVRLTGPAQAVFDGEWTGADEGPGGPKQEGACSKD
jgi:diaminopimelate epimerase